MGECCDLEDGKDVYPYCSIQIRELGKIKRAPPPQLALYVALPGRSPLLPMAENIHEI